MMREKIIRNCDTCADDCICNTYLKNCGVWSPNLTVFEKLEEENKELKQRIEAAFEIASETYDTDLLRCEAMVRALEGSDNGSLR